MHTFAQSVTKESFVNKIRDVEMSHPKSYENKNGEEPEKWPTSQTSSVIIFHSPTRVFSDGFLLSIQISTLIHPTIIDCA